MNKRFNIRVYGIWIHEGKLLVNEELIKDLVIHKFPGGGLEWGEGTVDCLKREYKEELGLDIEVGEHFYTTDYFQPSAYDDSQIMSIYYYVTGIAPEQPYNHMPNERTYWVDIETVSADTFTLPIDKRVGAMLKMRAEKGSYRAD